MTIAGSGTITSTEINAELGLSSGTLVFPDPTTRYLSGVGSGGLVLPNNFWGRSSLQLQASGAPAYGSNHAINMNFGIAFPGRMMHVIIFTMGKDSGADPTAGGNFFTNLYCGGYGGLTGNGPFWADSLAGTGMAGCVTFALSVPTGTSGTVSFNTKVNTQCVIYLVSGANNTAFQHTQQNAFAVSGFTDTIGEYSNGVLFQLGCKRSSGILSQSFITQRQAAVHGPVQGAYYSETIGWDNRLGAGTYTPTFSNAGNDLCASYTYIST
jgi:hypothetical protein